MNPRNIVTHFHSLREYCRFPQFCRHTDWNDTFIRLIRRTSGGCKTSSYRVDRTAYPISFNYIWTRKFFFERRELHKFSSAPRMCLSLPHSSIMINIARALVIATAVFASRPRSGSMGLDTLTTASLEKTCKAMEKHPLDFAKLSNSQLYELSMNPSPAALKNGVAFANVDRLCGNVDRLPLYLRQSILRQKVIHHHFVSSQSRLSARPVTLTTDLADIMRVPVSDLLLSDPSLASKLTTLMEASIFGYRIVMDRRSPVTLEDHRFMISKDSSCSPDEFRALGRVMALSFLLSVPMEKSFNPGFYDVILGKKDGWTRAELEMNYPAFQAAPQLSQSEIDLSISTHAK
jgi:hypothetical protein